MSNAADTGQTQHRSNGDGDDRTDQRPWAQPEPGRLMGRGHSAGDFLEAWKWTVLDEQPGRLQVEVHMPDHLKNPKGQLFGGFTPAYVDIISLYTVHSYLATAEPEAPRSFLNTINMRCDYFEPVLGPTFTIEGEVENRRGQIFLVSTKFRDGETMLAHAITTLRTGEPFPFQDEDVRPGSDGDDQTPGAPGQKGNKE